MRAAMMETASRAPTTTAAIAMPDRPSSPPPAGMASGGHAVMLCGPTDCHVAADVGITKTAASPQLCQLEVLNLSCGAHPCTSVVQRI